MAAKGGKFTSGGSPTSPKTVTSKPTSKGYSVRSGGKTRTVTASTPTVIVSSDDGVVTGVSGTGSRKAKRAARKAQEARTRRTRAVALLKPPKAQTAAYSAKAPKVPEPPKLPKRPTPVPAPKSKPQTFQGKPTAGTPTLKSLQVGSKSGTLKVNKRGYVTTPKVRKVAKQVKGLRAKARKSNAPLPGLDREQTKVARKVLRVGDQAKASKKEKLAAVETGLVESDFRNLPYGDADSLGWRQERASQYGVGPAQNVKGGARRFFQESVTDTGGSRGAGQTAGQLAQTIQGSAFPERYDETKPQAAAILHAYEKGGLKPKQARKLRGAEKQATKLGLNIAKPEAKVTKKQMTRFKAAQVAAKQLNKAGLPYVWGGGHNAGKVQVGSGVDCSGAVSYVLQKMGVKLPGGVVSGEMGSYLKPGPGAVTVFYNPEHTFMRIGSKYFGTSASNPGGGAGFIPTSVAGPEANSGSYSVGHVDGLGKKVAVALGVPLTGTSSFPGMTLSESGTTATINSGAGATVGKPGFSNSPIKLTPIQKARRTMRKLKAVGVGDRAPAPETSTTLAALERKYGGSAVV